MSGSVSSITFPNRKGNDFDIYVGTTESFILKGSALETQSYSILFEVTSFYKLTLK